jgi:hypothetical protein
VNALPLVRLEFIRGLRAPAAWFAAALLSLLAVSDWGNGGLARQGLWTAALLVFIPAWVSHAGGLLPRWRAGEGDWLGSRPVERGPALLAAWGGVCLAGLVWMALAAGTVELAAGGSWRDTRRLAWTQPLAEYLHLDPGQGRRFELHPPPTGAGATLRIHVRPTVGGAPTTDLRLALARGGEGHEVERHLATRGWIEAPVPAGDGPLWVQVDDLGAGALSIQGRVELWRPTTAAALGSLGLWWRAVLLASALGALALGAAAWVGPLTATGLALCAPLAGWTFGAPDLVPGMDLPSALGLVGEGRVPAATGGAPVLVALVLVLVGLGLARPGLASWRHGS